jgi:hypothetical protein
MTYDFVSGLLSAGAMGFWHGVEYYEKERVVGEEFYQQWNSVSTLNDYITQSDFPSTITAPHNPQFFFRNFRIFKETFWLNHLVYHILMWSHNNYPC